MIHVITTCTDRKRVPASPATCARSLVPAELDDLASEWRRQLEACSIRQSAATVYGGRSFQEALSAARGAGTELQIISAGLGLVAALREVPGYSLTLVRGSIDDIAARCVRPFSPAAWWAHVNGAEAPALARFVSAHPDDLVVIGLSATYARLVEADLLTLAPGDLRRLRLIGLSITPYVAPELRPFVLPYDARLDGPDSPNRGTRSDFASRAMHHFVSSIAPTLPSTDIEGHKTAVERCVGAWREAPRIERESMPDEAIIDVIRSSLSEVGRHSSKMLRHLRDEKRISCEQTRFKGLFKTALEERRS